MNGIQYIYPATASNGQVSQVIDGLSGETITYQYDALNRLTLAAERTSTGIAPACDTTSTVWSQQFNYDALGNRTVPCSANTGSIAAAVERADGPVSRKGGGRT